MLSTIGRAAIRRVGAGANASSTNRVLQSGWHLQRLDRSQNAENAFHANFVPLARQYVTASKTTQTKKPRAKAASNSGPKPKSKLKRAPKAPAKKAPKKKVAKKVVKKKAKVVKKKVLTPEQQTRQKIRELKKVALSAPTRKPETAWMVMLDETRSGAAPGESQTVMKTASAKYKSLSPEELQEFNHKASENKVANNVAYKQWVESHSPDEIRLANNARLALKKANVKPSHPPLLDDRLPKQAKSAWTFYFMERHAAGDFKHVKAAEAMQMAARDYSGLSGAEKKKYTDQHAADVTRYNTEFKTVYKRDPPYVVAAAAKA